MSKKLIPPLQLNSSKNCPTPARDFLKQQLPAFGSQRSSRMSRSVRSSGQCNSARSTYSRTGSASSARSRCACSELRYIFESQNILDECYHEFMLKLPQDLLDPEFARQYQRYTAAFDVFIKQTAVVFNSVNPNNTIRSFLTTSPLFIAGKKLMIEWVDFIERTNTISDNGLSPHLQKINESFATLFAGINRIKTALAAERFRTDNCVMATQKLRTAATKLREKTSGIFLKTKSMRWIGFDPEEFEKQTHHIIQSITQLFLKALPPNCLPCGEGAQLRVLMVGACSSIGSVIEAARCFDDQIIELKANVVDFNNELNALHRQLNLPFIVELSVDQDPNEPEKPDEEKGEPQGSEIPETE